MLIKNFEEFTQHINEKLILFNNGAQYGQVVFTAGGAGSGKSFAISNFMEAHKFKSIDLDYMQKLFLKFAREHPEEYKKFTELDQKNPNDVSRLHNIMKEKGFRSTLLTNILNSAVEGRLPNLLFDTTMKDPSKLHNHIPKLLKVGYDPENIHLVWTLTDYSIAVERNRSRERIVPDDVMLKSHDGAAITMDKLFSGNLPEGFDGSIKVILNNPEETIFWDNREIDIVKDFTYMTVKEPGEGLITDRNLRSKLYMWIKNNVPRTTQSTVFGK